jgi:heme/copper-type cytochrome/quinol oxidase subunit 1
VLGLLGLWTVTLFTGRIRPTGVLGMAVIAGLLLAIGVAMGIGTAIPETDLFGTTWTSGQAYAVLVATLVAGLAGLVFWSPKLYGRSLRDGVAKLVAPLALIGGLLVTVGYAVAGVLHQRWLLESFIDHGNEVTETDAVELLNVVAVAGIGVVLLAGVLVILGLLTGGPAEDDPWNGHTLEWATASPPPPGNFAELPEITSEAPIYDRRHAEASATGALAAGKEVSA